MRQTASLQAAIMTRVNLGRWIAQKRAQLQGKTEFPSIEINAIASHFLQQPTAWVISHPETALTDAQYHLMEDAVSRLLLGEPLAYITGHKSFFGLDFIVDNRVLIPRPETEILVEHALAWLRVYPEKRKVIDIGTGSGAIAIALVKKLAGLQVTAVDISAAALAVATANARYHKVASQIRLVESDLFEQVDQKFHLVLANLPYIPSIDLNSLSVVKYEPREALDGGSDGTELITRLIDTMPQYLLPGGCAILEIQYNQDNLVSSIAAHRFPDASISFIKDLASINRFLKIQL